MILEWSKTIDLVRYWGKGDLQAASGRWFCASQRSSTVAVVTKMACLKQWIRHHEINKHLHVFLLFFLSRLFSYVQLLKSFSFQDIHVLCLCQGCVKVRALSILLKVSGPPKEREVWPSTSCWQLLASWLFDQWPGLPFQITDVH